MELKKYIAIVRHWLWLIVLGAVLTGIITYIYNSNQTPIYRASAQYQIEAAPGQGNNVYADTLYIQRILQTYIVNITTNPVMEAVISELGLETTPNGLKRNVSVTSPQDTQIIVVSVTNPDPERAAEIANKIGEVYSQRNEELQNPLYLEQLTELDGELVTLNFQLTSLDSRISKLEQINTVEKALAPLNRALRDLRTTETFATELVDFEDGLDELGFEITELEQINTVEQANLLAQIRDEIVNLQSAETMLADLDSYLDEVETELIRLPFYDTERQSETVATLNESTQALLDSGNSPEEVQQILSMVDLMGRLEAQIQERLQITSLTLTLSNNLDDLQQAEDAAAINALFEPYFDDLESQMRAFEQTAIEQDGVQLSQLVQQRNETRSDYTVSYDARQTLELERARGTDSFIQIEKAVAPHPDANISPNPIPNTILATIVGGMLALGVVLLIEYLDDSVKTPDEIAAYTGLSTLATISFIDGENPSDRLISNHAPRDPISEAFRVLRTNLNFAAVDTDLRKILITSSAPGEGKSTTTANLATVMAQTGRKVILVDADLRRPSQHKIFEVSNNQGLTTALLDSSTPVTYHLQQTIVRDLRIMASGPLPPNPAELLNSHRMKDVLDGLLEEADILLIDTPPVLTVADAAILAPNVNGSVLVAEVGQTSRDALLESAERLKTMGAHVFGLVLNRSKRGKAGYYQYYYDNRYYTYEYSSQKPGQRAPRRLLGWLTGSNS